MDAETYIYFNVEWKLFLGNLHEQMAGTSIFNDRLG